RIKLSIKVQRPARGRTPTSQTSGNNPGITIPTKGWHCLKEIPTTPQSGAARGDPAELDRADKGTGF
ncbi:hypothetical protein, partial [Actinomadura luteofluorescens]|uniref:hypothetical protein n=1 Tax=Actinomadura luteofluorescens TaxID=46163 RepID=UPI0021645609